MRHTAAIILLILAAASASMMPGACAEGVPVPVAENVRGNGDTLALASAANDPKLMLADLVVLILRWSLGCAEGVLFAENVTVTPVMERNMIISMIVTTSTEKDIIPWKKWAFEVWNGKGKINYDDGSEYVGDKWTNMAEIDRKWSAKGYGEGNMKYKDGSEYSGKWFDGKRHGEGIQKWANGDVVFDGEWWIDCWRSAVLAVSTMESGLLTSGMERVS